MHTICIDIVRVGRVRNDKQLLAQCAAGNDFHDNDSCGQSMVQASAKCMMDSDMF